MFDNTNPYNLRTEVVEGITHYFVSFTDGQAMPRETEVSRPVYLEFLRFVKTERNLRRWDERHIEQSELTDTTLYKRALHSQQSVDDMTFDLLRNEQLQLAIQSLPEIQQQRFILYHDFGLTYEQIAEMEGRSSVAVKYTIDKAKKAITKRIKFFSD